MKGDLLDYMKWALLIGKYTGLMPIVGIETSGEIPRFTWKSISALVFLVNYSILIPMMAILIFDYISSSFAISRLNRLLLYFVHFISLILLFRFCRGIKQFITDVKELEILLPPARKPQYGVRRTKQLMLLVTATGLLEHVFYSVYLLYITHMCYQNTDDSGWFLKSYCLTLFSWYFDYFPFSYIIGAIFQILKSQMGVMWVYGDWIVMCTSIYLRNRFEDFNRLFMDEKCMFLKSFKPSWTELQVHYNRISKLVAIIDKYFNPFVFFSYILNLYFVCLDVYIILKSITQTNNTDQKDCAARHANDAIIMIAKVFNTCSLVTRTILISYLAAEVNSSSRKSLMVMHSTPSSAYNGDMHRLMTQIYYSNLGISGLNFFKITRGMVMAMVAKLLTYELVVVQL